MRPLPGGDLTSAKAELRSIYGLIRSAWAIEHGAFDWRITVPVNTTATVHVPAAANADVSEGGASAAEAPGVRLLRRDAATAVFEVGSGEYHFTAAE